jgi:subtilisin family serine protease
MKESDGKRRRRHTPVICGVVLAITGFLCGGLATAEPTSIRGSRMALSAAEVEMLQQQVSLDFQAAIDAKDRCDEEAFAKIVATLLGKLRYANASTTEMVRLSSEMASALGEMAEELRALLPQEAGAVDLVTRAGKVAAGQLPVVGLAINIVDELGELADQNAAVGAAGSVLRRIGEQLRALREVLENAERWQALHDEIAGVIERVQAYRWGPCFGPGDAPPSPSDDGAGGDVSKKDLTTVDGTGDAVGSTLVRIPPDENQDKSVVADDDRIDPDSDYIVAAQCHEPRVVSGRDLIRDRGARLRSSRRRFWVEPCESPEQALNTIRFLLAIAGIPFDPERDPYAIARHGKACLVSLEEGAPSAAKVAPGCVQTERKPDPPPFERGGGVPPANDDPGVDEIVVEPIDPKDPLVETNQPSRIARPAAPAPFPDDPFFRSVGSWGQPYRDQWGLHRIGFAAAAGEGAPSLWPAAATPVVVAVVDTGIDLTHPELVGALWTNQRDLPGNGLDDDGNGYVDDLYGWNFVDGNHDVSDLNGHGTVTAGIIAAWTGNGSGIAGVNPWARIMPLKVASWKGDAWNFDIADAIRYAADNGARVINVSIAGERLRRSEYLAVAYARSKGAIVVAAAGNEGRDVGGYSPAGLPGVVTVAASDLDDRRTGFSNWGAGVDLAAPGVDILSLRARQSDLLEFEREDYVAGTAIVGKDRRQYRLTGTSFSAPFVSGVASLILALRPELTATQVTRMLMHSARDIETPGWDQYTGYGLLDAKAALAADPDYYVLPRIRSVAGVKSKEGFVLQVTGRAMASDFGKAWVEIGRGGEPQEWVRASEEIVRPIADGLLASIPAARFAGSRTWTVRLVVVHANGTRREARFKLEVG